MKIRRLVLAASVLLAFSPAVRADEFSDNFTANLNPPSLKAFAKGMGSLLGAGSFHTGETLNFPIGFDVGFHVAGVQIKNDNPILRDNKSFIPVGWLQAELGLPARVNLIARYGKLFNADLYGGGLRVGLIKSELPGLPSVSLTGLYDEARHDYFKAKTLTTNVVLSFDVPIVHPYIGAGYDYTRVDPTSKAFATAPASVNRGLDAKASGYRVEAGVNLSIIPFTYMTLGGGLANGGKMGHVALGVRF